jgi:hypothetical protein
MKWQSILCLPYTVMYGHKRRFYDVVVSVLAVGNKVLGFKPGRDNGFLMAIKICSTSSFCEGRGE